MDKDKAIEYVITALVIFAVVYTGYFILNIQIEAIEECVKQYGSECKILA